MASLIKPATAAFGHSWAVLSAGLGAQTRSVLRALSLFCLCALVAACQSAPRSGEVAPRGTPQAPTLLSEALGGPIESGFAVPLDANGGATIALLAPVGDNRAPIQALARSLVDAAQMALADMRNPNLRLQIFDTQGTPAGAAEAATAAVQAGSAVIVGPLFATSVQSAAPIANAAGLPMISFSTDAGSAGDNVYLIGFLPQQEIERIVGYAFASGVQNFAGLTPNTDYGAIATSALYEAASRNGGRVAAVQRYERNFQGIEQAVKDFVPQYTESSTIDPVGAILLADQGQALQTLAAYLAYFDVSQKETKFIGTGIWNDPVTQKETALRTGWFAAPDPNLIAQFNARYRQSTGRDPHPLAGLGFDAIAAVGAMVAEATGKGEAFAFTPQAVTSPAGFVGVNGVFRFLPNGLNERGLAVLEVTQSGFTVIDPAPTTFAGL